jgi:hypothetical protein
MLVNFKPRCYQNAISGVPSTFWLCASHQRLDKSMPAKLATDILAYHLAYYPVLSQILAYELEVELTPSSSIVYA